MPDLDWEDEDIPDGVDPRTAPVLIHRRPDPPQRQPDEEPQPQAVSL